jgi:hypothetical protein
MRSHDWVLDLSDQLIRHACLSLAEPERYERYQEWTGELPAILYDPELRPAFRRISRTLVFALDQHRTTMSSGTILLLVPLWIVTSLIGGPLVAAGALGAIFFGFWSILDDNLHGVLFLEVSGAWVGSIAVMIIGNCMFLGMMMLTKHLRRPKGDSKIS